MQKTKQKHNFKHGYFQNSVKTMTIGNITQIKTILYLKIKKELSQARNYGNNSFFNRQIHILKLLYVLFKLLYPVIQKIHLFFRVKPMFSVFHDGKCRTNLLGKLGHGFVSGQVIFFSI